MGYDAWKTRESEYPYDLEITLVCPTCEADPCECCPACHAGPLEACAEDCARDRCALHGHTRRTA